MQEVSRAKLIGHAVGPLSVHVHGRTECVIEAECPLHMRLIGDHFRAFARESVVELSRGLHHSPHVEVIIGNGDGRPLRDDDGSLKPPPETTETAQLSAAFNPPTCILGNASSASVSKYPRMHSS